MIAIADTVKSVDAAGIVTGTIDRANLRIVQTPQAFAFAPLLDAHRRALAAGREDFTDDAALAEWAGLEVSTFEGEAGNVKLTTNEDFARAEAAKLAALSDVRTGFGFDVHQFGDGDHVMLGGVRIPHPRGLSGHSDADVVLHALVDAILGALADGDIGVHFPPSDPQWRGASSDRFLAFAVERLRARGGRIAHLDVTVVCEAPRVGPHRDAIRARIAEIAGIPLDRVGVKATTSEKMGFTGRGEGMAAFANATIRLPWSDVMPDRELSEQAQALLDLCRGKRLKIAAAESCTGGLVAATLDRDRRLLRRVRTRLRDLQQRGQAGDARRASGHARQPRRGEPRDRRGDGQGRARPCAGRSRGLDHRHRRAGRRNSGKAGRARAFRRRFARRGADPP